MGNAKKIFFVINHRPFHVGGHLKRAAELSGISFRFCDMTQALDAPYPVAKFNWWFRGHRPSRLSAFSQNVVVMCKEFCPDILLSTGLAPIDESALQKIGKLGTRRLNYLTDDPFNKAHHAPWFIKSLPLYDHIFSTRQANIGDLKKAGCPHVTHLPFAYNPEVHYPPKEMSREDMERYGADIAFVGGADKDRVPYIIALLQGGFRVKVYGGYWDKVPEAKQSFFGHVDAEGLRKAIGCAKVVLCFVRRSNRDGSSMRTFETPAIGACMLTEDTEEHRKIFGGEKEAVVYFQTIPEMITALGWLLDHDSERKRLAEAARAIMIGGRNTYRDRLATMISEEQ